jgi:type I restriction enzyme S subunit
VNFKPYPEYKESGIPWFEKIPRHWELRKTKFTFNERVQKGFPDEPLLAATQTKGVVLKSQYENRTVIPQKDLHLLKLVKKGDFVISLRSFQGGIELAHCQGIISPAYTIMSPKETIDIGYYKHLAKSKPFIELLKTCVTGIREGQNIDYEILKRNKIPLPSREEQRSIARFLGYKTAQISRFIRAKKRMVELLSEEINIFIYGKDKLTNNYIINDWDNAFPKSWIMIKAKRIFSEVNIKNKPEKDLLAVTQDRGVIPKSLCDQNYVSPSGSLDGLKLVRNNDFVISLRSFQGGIEFSEYEGIVSPAYNIFSLDEVYSCIEYQKYYQYLFKSKPFISLLNTIISGIRDGKNISFKDFGEVFIPLPPKKSITSFVHLFSFYEFYKNQFQKGKKLLEEYRTRLIADVVTGKVDVRDIEVPDVADDELAVEDQDETEDTGETTEDAGEEE